MMVRLANQLATDGDEVSMILISKGGVNKPYLSDKVNLFELKCKRTLSAFGPLRRQLKTINPDGILAVLTHINVITAVVAFSLGWIKKLSVSERNAFSLDKKVNSNFVMKTAYGLAPFVYRFLPKPVIAVSQGVAKDLVDTTVVKQKNVITAPNPVITEELKRLALEPASHPWLLNKKAPVIVAIGRLSYQKGFDMLLDAFYKVRKQIECRLVIFGEGDLRQKLNEQIRSLNLESDVSLPGYSENVIAELNYCDLYVLSSRFEGSPNAIVEAMAVGTKVVAFDCPHGARDILHHGKLDYLVTYLDVDKLAGAMVDALNQKDFNKEAQIDAVKCFEASNSAQVYRELILS